MCFVCPFSALWNLLLRCFPTLKYSYLVTTGQIPTKTTGISVKPDRIHVGDQEFDAWIFEIEDVWQPKNLHEHCKCEVVAQLPFGNLILDGDSTLFVVDICVG